MREIEQAIDFIYENIDFFGAPFLDGATFQRWAQTHPEIKNLSIALKDAIDGSQATLIKFDDSKSSTPLSDEVLGEAVETLILENRKKDKLGVSLPEFANALVGNALLHMDSKKATDKNCLLYNNREPIRSILMNNQKLLGVIKGSMKDSVIELWYKTAASPYQIKQRQIRKEKNLLNEAKSEQAKNVLKKYNAIIMVLKKEIIAKIKIKYPVVDDEMIQESLEPFFNEKNLEDLVFNFIIFYPDQHLDPLRVFKVIYYDQSLEKDSIENYVKKTLGQKNNLTIATTLGNYIAKKYNNPTLSKNISSLEIAIDEIFVEIIKNLQRFLKKEGYPEKQIEQITNELINFININIFAKQTIAKEDHLKIEVIKFLQTLGITSHDKRDSKQEKPLFKEILNGFIKMNHFMKEKYIRMKFYGDQMTEENYKTKFNIENYIKEVESKILIKLQDIIEQDEKQRDQAQTLMTTMIEILSSNFYLNNGSDDLLSDIQQLQFTTKFIALLLKEIMDDERNRPSDLWIFNGADEKEKINFFALFNEINTRYSDIFDKLFDLQKTTQLNTRTSKIINLNCMVIKFENDLFTFDEADSADNYQLLKAGFAGEIKIPFSKKTNISFFKESVKHHLRKTNQFLKSTEADQSPGELTTDAKDLSFLAECFMFTELPEEKITLETFIQQLKNVGVDETAKINLIINILFQGRGGLIQQMDFLPKIFKSAEEPIFTESGKSHLLVLPGYFPEKIIIYVKTPVFTRNPAGKLEENESRYQIILNFADGEFSCAIENYFYIINSACAKSQFEKIFSKQQVVLVKDLAVDLVCKPYQQQYAKRISPKPTEEKKKSDPVVLSSVSLSPSSALFSSSSAASGPDKKSIPASSLINLDDFRNEIEQITFSPSCFEKMKEICQQQIKIILDYLEKNKQHAELVKDAQEKLSEVEIVLKDVRAELGEEETVSAHVMLGAASAQSARLLTDESLTDLAPDRSMRKDKPLPSPTEDTSEPLPSGVDPSMTSVR